MPRQGDIVLVPVPFTDLSSLKRRPVVAISNETYQQTTPDFVAVALTSQLSSTRYGFTITTDDLTRGSLRRPSQVRVDRIFTLAQSIIVQQFGRAGDAVLARIQELFRELTAVAP